MINKETTDCSTATEVATPGSITCSSAGLSYGRYGISTDNYLIHCFITWLKDQNHPFGRMLDQFGPGSREFSCCWQYIAESDPDEFDNLQYTYLQNTNYQPASA